MSDFRPPFPRQPEDPGEVRRLRDEAMRRLEREDGPPAAPVYGGPPMGGGGGPERQEPVTIYGGPPSGGGGGRTVTRRLTLIGLMLMLVGGIGAIIAWFMGRRPPAPAAVYGGPPPNPGPTPKRDPVVQPDGKPGTESRPAQHHSSEVRPKKPQPAIPAAVYGGPPPPTPPQE